VTAARNVEGAVARAVTHDPVETAHGVAAMADVCFDALGTTVRVVVEAPDAHALAARACSLVKDYDRRLSRFRPDSELCALNADPRERVPASPLLCDAVDAALWAARRSGGLVDPTLLPQLERAGYDRSMRPAAQPRVPSGPRRPARPHPVAAWRRIAVERGAIVRPPGMRLDLGGSGKGHVADLVAQTLGHTRRWAVDCGGDVRVGGVVEQEIEVAHPFGEAPEDPRGLSPSYEGDRPVNNWGTDPFIFGGQTPWRVGVTEGAVATSAVHARAWPGGHHLLDPATGEPVWTGVVQATATAPTTLEAETLAKMAVFGGPQAAQKIAIAWVGA
jgi:FAD:protein FMN transferase